MQDSPRAITGTIGLPRGGDMARMTPAASDSDRPIASPAAISIEPATNDLTLNPSDEFDESINVAIPRGNGFRSVNLVPSASIAPFIDFINPPGGYGAVSGKQDQTLTFRVRFHGIPCTPELRVVNGTLDVVGNGKVIAKKDVKITVPACPPTGFIFSAKFICGEQQTRGCECTPVQPGRYATEINIHNYGIREVAIQKRFIPVVLAGAPVGREPKVVAPRADDKIILPPQTATMDDCCRIAELLFGGEAASPMPITIGFLEITSNGPIAVTAVYTATGLDSPGISIDVEEIAPRRA
jgi:hypothetical protein